jgi:hypothetical protein
MCCKKPIELTKSFISANPQISILSFEHTVDCVARKSIGGGKGSPLCISRSGNQHAQAEGDYESGYFVRVHVQPPEKNRVKRDA